MTPSDLTAIVHAFAPHSRVALYLSSAIAALLAVLVVYLRCMITGSCDYLDSRWIARTAAGAAPIPIYVLLLLAPLDEDLFTALRTDEVVVALAGLFGLLETLKDIREAAANAHRDKIHGRRRPPD